MGCLTANPGPERLATAVRAVAAGQVVLSPELAPLWTRAEAPPRPTAHLTIREHEVFALLADGLTSSEVAASLAVSVATVKSHVSHVLSKLGARNRLEAVLLMRGTPTTR